MASGTDNEAVARGYTRHVIANSTQHEFACLVKPAANLDGVVKAFNTDDQEWLCLNGWLFTFEDAEQ